MKTTIAAATIALAATGAQAVQVTWVDWTSATANSAEGTLTVDGRTIDVSFANSVNNNFVQTNSGDDYWLFRDDTFSSAYTTDDCSDAALCADDAPTGPDIVALTPAGTRTVTFSETVEDVYFAFVSWNIPGNATFSTDLLGLTNGAGYWGSGSYSVSGSTFSPAGEAHGTLLLPGSLDGFSFDSPGENWHGFTVGVAGTAPPPAIPLPAAGWLLAGALAGTAALRGRGRRG